MSNNNNSKINNSLEFLKTIDEMSGKSLHKYSDALHK